MVNEVEPNHDDIKIMFLFTLKNTNQLAKQIIRKTKLKLGQYETKHLSDGEFYLQLKNKVKGQDVFVMGSTSQPNDNILEFLILINALKTNGAKKITAIIPYFGYARQDKVDKPGAPITAKLLADFFKKAGVYQFITIDIHSQRDKNYLKPLLNLDPLPIFANYIKKNINLKNTIIVAPDNGARLRAIELAKLLDPLPVLLMEKYRPKQDLAKISKFKKNIAGKNIIITDDMIDTAGTIIAACNELKKHKVNNIYVFATHGVLSGPALSRIKNAPIKQVIISDSFPMPKAKLFKKIKILSIAPLLINYLK
ncbi:MAG: ribose-phosphate pyrophosphokinase [Candidatus Parcubacteria bacterium]|nr:ribose-phosphate pyrophosphokinase [Candidatus Parcubacteria bacterium]